MHIRMNYKALITDVDNTLFDWFGLWHASFTAMLDEVIRISNVPRQQLLEEMQHSFRRHRTSEYAFVLEDCPCLSGFDPKKDLAPAIEAYRTARERKLRLYKGVRFTLATLKRHQVPIVAYTESIRFYTADRFRRLKIASYFDALYSPADHAFPAHSTKSANPAPALKTRDTPPHHTKPDPTILEKIVAELKLRPRDCVYVGDSKAKDIAMANTVGVHSVWAKYGASHLGDDRYDLLRSVTHWTDEEVARERAIAEGQLNVTPNSTIERFDQVLCFFMGEHSDASR